MKLLKAIGRFFATILLLVLCMTFFIALILIFKTPSTASRFHALLPFIIGFAGGGVCFGIFASFNRIYIFGHELTHFITAKFFARRTGHFRVRKGSGSVAIERPNLWITLAPYFIPIYALIWTGIYGFCQFLIKPLPPWLTLAFPAGLGITYAHHIIFTIKALRTGQSDLRRHGFFFSLSLVLFCNLLLLFGGTTVAVSAWEEAETAIHQTIKKEAELGHKLINFIASL